jgi:tetratricopeptide (TPR) repeat protein
MSRFLLLLFLFALLVRGAYAWRIRDLPTQHSLVMDARRYDERAREIVADGPMPREVFFQAPLYPYLLAAVYAPTGGSRVAARVVQILADALTAVLLAVVAARLFGPAAGRVAGLLAALYGPFVFSSPLLLKTTFTLLAEAALLLALIPRPGESGPGRGRMLLAGLCLGIAALLQENLLLLAPCVVLFLFLRGGLARWDAAAAFALGVGLCLAPVALVNHRVGGELVLTSSRGGLNFYFGNCRGASGIFPSLGAGTQDPERLKEESRRLAASFEEQRTGRPVRPAALTPGRVSAIFWAETLRQMGADPLAWARLMLWKLRLFWNAYEVPDAEGYRVYRRAAGAVSWPWIGFGLVAPFGLAGLALAWRRPGAQLLALLTVGLCVSVVAFFVFGRYRLPVVPFLIPPAGFALVALADLLRQRRWRELALPSLLAALLLVAVSFPAFSAAEKRAHDAAIWFNLGSAALRWAEAEDAAFRAGLTRAPALQAVAHLERAAGLAGEAADDLAEAVAGNPAFFIARVQRVVALHRRGVYLASGGAFEPALASYAAARRELAPLLRLLAAGAVPDFPEVAEVRQLAVTLDANTAGALTNLGGRRIEAGDLAGAEAALRRAVALAPASAEAAGNLGLCLLRRGDRAASREAFARALALAGPAARAGETAFYRRGLELASAAP